MNAPVDKKERRHAGSGWTSGQSVAVYLAAGVAFVALGVMIPELLFSWWEGVPFLLLFVWLVHTLWKRLT